MAQLCPQANFLQPPSPISRPTRLNFHPQRHHPIPQHLPNPHEAATPLSNSPLPTTSFRKTTREPPNSPFSRRSFRNPAPSRSSGPAPTLRFVIRLGVPYPVPINLPELTRFRSTSHGQSTNQPGPVVPSTPDQARYETGTAVRHRFAGDPHSGTRQMSDCYPAAFAGSPHSTQLAKPTTSRQTSCPP